MLKKKWSLEARMVWWMSVLLILVIGLLGGTYYVLMVDHIEEQVGKRALVIAQTVAEMPEIKRAFDDKEPSQTIQPLVEKIRKQTKAEFIVVGNKKGIRYSHPIPERIGKNMVGGDNGRALLRGESYVSKAIGSLGPSLRGKVPIRDDQGRVIGIVSVGILLSDIDEMSRTYFARMATVIILVFSVAVMGATYLAKGLKKSIFGLEPEEISVLFQQRDTVIESVREGIIMIDGDGNLTLFNQAAVGILGLVDSKQAIGSPIRTVLPNTRLLEVLQSGEAELDREMNINGKEIVVNRLPIRSSDQVVGAVASFRLKSEMDQLNEKLSQVKRYVEALRAQTHEYQNTLYTISGLIQLKSYQEAIELIHRESEIHQDHVSWVMEKIADPWLGAILIGFYNRARELKIDFIIERESGLGKIPQSISHPSLVSILGNLITNAFEAVQNLEEGERKVKLFITDIGETIWIEVEDSGAGIQEEHLSHIFDQGFSTKSSTDGVQRGFGLAKVKQLSAELGGAVTIEQGEWGGAVFAVALPKQERKMI
ncbi:ATP-binding protein [Laceyella putida]|uniref:histidine kinase n=1 Tax=Laceyella putida TaxID=110101 RepID=A0ABW2RJU7_9BACL